MLFWALKHLSQAECIGALEKCVFVDNHSYAPFDPDIPKVIEMYPGLNLKTVIREPDNTFGNARNMLEAYRWAYETGFDFAFMVECDVMIARDFFAWHRHAQREFKPFASIGFTGVAIGKYMPPGDMSCYKGPAYTSLGVCLPRESLGRIAEHAKPEYYGDQHGYLDRMFPDSRWLGMNHSQDGCLSRIVEHEKLFSVLPCRPRCFHAGYYGYNRSQSRKPKGTLEERIAEVGRVLASRDELVKDYKDCEPCELE
jgi:hypothetical protein